MKRYELVMLLLAIIAIIVAFTSPEIRIALGLEKPNTEVSPIDNSTSNKSSNTSTTPVEKKESFPINNRDESNDMENSNRKPQTNKEANPQLYNSEMGTANPGIKFEKSKTENSKVEKEPPQPIIENIEDDNVIYEFMECKRQGNNLKIVIFLNSKEDKQLAIVGHNYGDNSTMAFDDLGNSYKVEQINIGGLPINPNYGKKIIQGIPTEMVLLFKGLNIRASTISLQLSFNRGDHHFMARDLPLK